MMTRWSLENPGTVAVVATLSLHPMTPTALLKRTVKNQSRTNAWRIEKKMAVLLTATTVPARTERGSTSYMSGRMSGLAATVGDGFGVGRYSGASTLHAARTAARRAPVRTRRITPRLDPRRETSGG